MFGLKSSGDLLESVVLLGGGVCKCRIYVFSHLSCWRQVVGLSGWRTRHKVGYNGSAFGPTLGNLTLFLGIWSRCRLHELRDKTKEPGLLLYP